MTLPLPRGCGFFFYPTQGRKVARTGVLLEVRWGFTGLSVEVWGTHTESVRWEAGEWGGGTGLERWSACSCLCPEKMSGGVYGLQRLGGRPGEAWRQTPWSLRRREVL